MERTKQGRQIPLLRGGDVLVPKEIYLVPVYEFSETELPFVGARFTEVLVDDLRAGAGSAGG